MVSVVPAAPLARLPVVRQVGPLVGSLLLCGRAASDQQPGIHEVVDTGTSMQPWFTAGASPWPSGRSPGTRGEVGTSTRVVLEGASRKKESHKKIYEKSNQVSLTSFEVKSNVEK